MSSTVLAVQTYNLLLAKHRRIENGDYFAVVNGAWVKVVFEERVKRVPTKRRNPYRVR